MVKKMCYEDARLIPYLLNSKAFMKWVKDVRKFSEGNSVLADTILGMTDCYAEYLTRKIGKTCATKRMQQYIQTLEFLSEKFLCSVCAESRIQAVRGKSSCIDIRYLVIHRGCRC